MDILSVFILPIHVHGIAFHFFMSLLVSFCNVLQFSLYRPFTSLVKFTHRHFVLFDVIVNGIVFFTSLSVSLLLEYRTATDFCKLISYPATLLQLSIISHSFSLDSSGLSIYKIMSSANSESFNSSLPTWIPFISLSCLSALAKTSSTMLNKSGESGHPCLVPVLRG
uniref:Uncharacterized protein n=1 Tax=Equus asinus TaxID=9793 RepID=A0A9L0IZJ9_EQUAS